MKGASQDFMQTDHLAHLWEGWHRCGSLFLSSILPVRRDDSRGEFLCYRPPSPPFIPRLHDPSTTCLLPFGRAAKIGSTSARISIAVTSDGLAPSVLTTIKGSPSFNSLRSRPGARSNICCTSSCSAPVSLLASPPDVAPGLSAASARVTDGGR